MQISTLRDIDERLYNGEEKVTVFTNIISMQMSFSIIYDKRDLKYDTDLLKTKRITFYWEGDRDKKEGMTLHVESDFDLVNTVFRKNGTAEKIEAWYSVKVISPNHITAFVYPRFFDNQGVLMPIYVSSLFHISFGGNMFSTEEEALNYGTKKLYAAGRELFTFVKRNNTALLKDLKYYTMQGKRIRPIKLGYKHFMSSSSARDIFRCKKVLRRGININRQAFLQFKTEYYSAVSKRQGDIPMQELTKILQLLDMETFVNYVNMFRAYVICDMTMAKRDEIFNNMIEKRYNNG